MLATRLPFGEMSVVCSVISRGAPDPLVTSVSPYTVAFSRETSGELTNSPSGSIWIEFTITSRTWR